MGASLEQKRGGLVGDALWGVGLAASRILLAIALGAALKWADPSDDVSFQLVYASRPGVLLGLEPVAQGEYLPPFPPLLPVVLFLISVPAKAIGGLIASGAGAFLAMRLGYALFEGLGLWATRASMRKAGVGPRATLLASFLWLIAPVGWMSASVMCQEELVGVAFAGLMVWLVVTRRVGLALLAAGFGVVVAKVYFLVPIAGLIVAGPWTIRELARRAALGFGPIALTYAWVIPATGGVGFASFTPGVEPSINLWGLTPYLADIDAGTLKKVSAVPALALGMLPALAARLAGGFRVRHALEGVALVRLITAQWLWVFFAFYLVSPEYFVLALPGLLVSLFAGSGGGWKPWAWVAGLLTLPWATNFAYGVAAALERAGDGPVRGGKAVFVRLWNAASPIDPTTGHIVGIVGFALGLGTLAVLLTIPRRGGTASVSHEPDHRHADLLSP